MYKNTIRTWIKKNLLLNDKLNTRAYSHNSKFRKKHESKFILLLKRTGCDSINEAIYCIMNETAPHRCPVCDTKSIYDSFSYGYKTFCSSECAQSTKGRELSQIKQRQTNLKRYGVEQPFANPDVQAKIKATNKERYGFENPSSSPDIRAKVQSTLKSKYGKHHTQTDEHKERMRAYYLEQYGVDNPLKSEEVKDKIKKLNLDRYGVHHAMQSDEIKERAKITNLERYGCLSKNGEHITNREDLSKEFILTNFVRDGFVLFEEMKTYFNISDSGLYKTLAKLHIPYGKEPSEITSSNLEKEVLDYVRSIYSGIILENRRNIIPPQELDIVIPEKKVAIEFNGDYWHSSLQKEPAYHLNKTKAANEQGYLLLHISEYEWRDEVKKSIWKSVIQNKLGLSERLYARNCTVKTVSSSEAALFTSRTHLQGHSNASKYYGLFYKDSLVALASMTKSRFDKDYEYELLRFSSELGVTVVGGFSKIMKHIKEDLNIETIFSYANRRWSNGNVYALAGTYLRETNPGYVYVKDSVMYTRQKFQKHKIKALYEKGLMKFYDGDLTEEENMIANGYLKIYDAGNLKFEV